MNDALARFRRSVMRRDIQDGITRRRMDAERLGVAASVTGSIDLPVSARDRDWDGDAAKRRVMELCDGDTDCTARAFLWREPDADPTTQAAWKLGFADVIDGRLTIIPAGVAATAGGRGVDASDIPEEDKARIRSKITRLYDHIRDTYEDWPESPFERDEE